MPRHLKAAMLATFICGSGASMAAQADGPVSDGVMTGTVAGTEGSVGATTSSATGTSLSATRNTHGLRRFRDQREGRAIRADANSENAASDNIGMNSTDVGFRTH